MWAQHTVAVNEASKKTQKMFVWYVLHLYFFSECVSKLTLKLTQKSNNRSFPYHPYAGFALISAIKLLVSCIKVTYAIIHEYQQENHVKTEHEIEVKESSAVWSTLKRCKHMLNIVIKINFKVMIYYKRPDLPTSMQSHFLHLDLQVHSYKCNLASLKNSLILYIKLLRSLIHEIKW